MEKVEVSLDVTELSEAERANLIAAVRTLNWSAMVYRSDRPEVILTQEFPSEHREFAKSHLSRVSGADLEEARTTVLAGAVDSVQVKDIVGTAKSAKQRTDLVNLMGTARSTDANREILSGLINRDLSSRQQSNGDGKVTTSTASGGGGSGNGGDSQPPGDTATNITTNEAAAAESQLDKLALTLLNDLTEDEKRQLALAYFSVALNGQVSSIQHNGWAEAANLVLLDRSPADSRGDLASELLRRKEDIPGNRAQMERQRVRLAKVQVEAAKVSLATAEEVLKHMKRWRRLSVIAMRFMVPGFIFAALMVAALFIELDRQRISAVLVPIVIFVLAIFAISPAVLLLVERPLKGMDEYPGKPDATETDSQGDTTASDTTKKSNP
jgi:hypothetical protein